MRLPSLLRILPGLALALAAAPAASAPLACLPFEGLDGRCPAWGSEHPGAGADGVYAMTVSPNGQTVYSVGLTNTDDGYRALAAAYDAATGEQRWARAEGRPGDEHDYAAAVATSPDGSTVYVAGTACGDITDGATCDVLLTAHDAATGAPRWTVIQGGETGGLDSAQDVAVSPDGDLVYVGGQTLSSGNDVDYLVAAYEASDGERVWSATYDGPGHGFDRGAELGLADGLLVLTGRSPGAGGDDDIATVAFRTEEDEEGEIAWVARHGGAGPDQALGLDADASGERIVVAGESTRSGLPTRDPIVLAYDADTGDEEWARRYDDPGIAGGTLFDVAISPDGSRVVAGGFTQRSDGKGPTALAFDGDGGTRLWAVNLQNGLHYAVETSPDATRAYVTGSMTSQRGTLHRTVGYTFSSGAQRWAATYEEQAPPAGINSTLLLPSAIAMPPDGTHVYVGGATRVLGASQDDALTLSYQA